MAKEVGQCASPHTQLDSLEQRRLHLICRICCAVQMSLPWHAFLLRSHWSRLRSGAPLDPWIVQYFALVTGWSADSAEAQPIEAEWFQETCAGEQVTTVLDGMHRLITAQVDGRMCATTIQQVTHIIRLVSHK
jgi:hypothetical protein